jgi:hypothetical protein
LYNNLKIKVYIIIFLQTLKEVHRLRVFANRLLTRIFGQKRDEITGCWRKLHKEELHNLHSSPDIIRKIRSRRMELTGHVAHMGDREGRPRHN